MTLGSTQVIVSEILYDSLGRQAITTVPVIKQDYPSTTINASPFGFSSDFISSRDPQQESSTWVDGGALTGTITSWVDPTSFCLEGDPNYAYQGVYYETDPTSRTLQSSKPGITFQKSQDFSNPGYSESYYADYFPQALYNVLPPSQIQIPNASGQANSFTSPNSFPYMPMAAQQTSLGNLRLITQASWKDNAGRVQAKATVDANNHFILKSLSYQTGATLSEGLPFNSTSACPIMRQKKIYLPNFFDPSVDNQESFYTSKQMNALGQVVQTQSPDQGITVYYTDLFGRLRYSQTADQLTAGMIQYYLYDALNRIIEVGLYPGSWDVGSFQQNTLTLLTLQPDHAQVQRTITYDQLSSSSFDPNAQGKMAQSLTYPIAENSPSSACVTETYSYDSWGRLVTITKEITNLQDDSPFIAGSFTTQYTYNGLSKVLEITYPSTFATLYSYNLQGLVNQISYAPTTDVVYSLASYTYNEQGQIASEIFCDGNASTSTITSTYAHGNSLNQLTSINTTLSTSSSTDTPLFSEGLCYTNDSSGDNTKGTYQDGNIQLTSYTYGFNTDLNYQLTYAYDAFGRLYGAEASGGWGPWVSFGSDSQYDNFDSNGNYLLNMSYTPSTKGKGTNQVSQATVSAQRSPYTSATFTYTDSGLTSLISYSSTNSENLPYTMTLTSDLMTQRPLQITLTNEEQTADSFLYDSQGERIQKIVSTTSGTSVLTYVRGKGAQVLAEYDDNNNPQTYYIQGPTGIVSLYDPPVQQNTFVIKDHLGSTRVAFNASTTQVTSYYGYDSFGTLFIADGNYWVNNTGPRYLYTGQEWDRELGLYNYHARHYDPLYTKRFLSPDPAHQFPSPYTYCANNPINATDPTGRTGGANAEFTGNPEAFLSRNLITLDAQLRGSYDPRELALDLNYSGINDRNNYPIYQVREYPGLAIAGEEPIPGTWLPYRVGDVFTTQVREGRFVFTPRLTGCTLQYSGDYASLITHVAGDIGDNATLRGIANLEQNAPRYPWRIEPYIDTSNAELNHTTNNSINFGYDSPEGYSLMVVGQMDAESHFTGYAQGQIVMDENNLDNVIRSSNAFRRPFDPAPGEAGDGSIVRIWART
ncbi:hypothetical protein IM40_05875 [Candidatus Paracaedimonas acanthamoebae]|nr:hypothetical protein IM40_05875 [Candidatus Paracaedimonas acanthamoebae]